MAKGTCLLCKKTALIKNSHIIPSFVGKWLKNTSVTGYLRQIVNPNLRKQDIATENLLCDLCELLLSKYEDSFSKNIFYPYVNEELDEWGVAQGSIKEFEYKEWLLKFMVSVQWRSLITSKELKNPQYIHFVQPVMNVLREWEDFLLDRKGQSGHTKHYLIFLQNLVTGIGSLPPNINPRINTYLIRSLDTTFACNKKNIFVFSKSGPIVLISTIIPEKLDDMDDTSVKLQGKIKTVQSLRNHMVNDFIFITRPNECFERYNISDKQDKLINDDIKRKIPKAKNLNSVLASYSDFLMNKGK